MKLIKQFICLVVCFVVLSSSFIVGHATEDEFNIPDFPSVDDLYDLGFVYEDGVYIYPGGDDPFDFGFSFNIATEKNHTSFSPDQLPWSSMPDYIQTILNLKLSSYYPTESNSLIPFVLIRVRSVVEVYVGTNVFLGRYNNSTGSFNIFAVNSSSTLFNNSACYWATYSHSGELLTNWDSCPRSVFGDTNSVYQLQSYFFGNMDTSGLDYYLWGGNAAKITSYSANTIAIPCNSSDTNLNVSCYQSAAGFSNGNFLPLQTHYPYTYFEYFEPLTKDGQSIHLQEEQVETSKSIWETLKSVLEYIINLPGKIAESLKSFFDTLNNGIAKGLTNLSSNINGFFTSIGDRISGFFTSIGDRISGFFISIGDRINGFFESLKNYILYFQETEPLHVNPFAEILTDVKNFFDNQIKETYTFRQNLATVFSNVSDYISTGSNIINSILNGVPILNAILIFFLAFFVVRKVVGR